MKTVLALRHLAFEDLGLLEPAFEQRGWCVRTLDVGVDPLRDIDLEAIALLVVLGGPIGAFDDAIHPVLADEVRLIAARLASRRPLLGICLGAQLMARALGAQVAPMAGKEIGYSPLTLTEAGRESPLSKLAAQSVLHWHGDQFDIPPGATHLAATAHCPNQAFCIGETAMAWQFHLEVDAARIEQWLIGHSVELHQARVDVSALRAEAARQRRGLEAALDAVLDDWLARCALDR